MNEKQLKVLFLAAEAVPFAKMGGLADVAGSLPKALRALGHDVRLMIPRYGTIRSDQFRLRKIGEPFHIPLGPGEECVHLVGGALDKDEEKQAYLIWNDQYFSSRDRLYGFEDDAQRFAVFGRAALAALRLLDWKPDVIHANDWHTALAPTWLNTEGRRDPFYADIATLFTIHNPTMQGSTGRLILTFAQMEYLKHLSVEQPGTVNWMAQGIAHTDLINTVSPSYAQEILTPEMGIGLDPLLRERKDRLFGILNGIDYEQWNPATDAEIPHRFDIKTLNMRATNKTALQQQLRLPVRPQAPLVGMVTRLDEAKGMELIEPVLEWLLEKEVQFVLVGAGQDRYCEMIERVQARFPEKMRGVLKFDDVLGRRIYAGADMLLIPSVVEPCGLGQMIAMRYGCAPVVSETGGLADTVVDYTASRSRGNGFVFKNHTTRACRGALQRALRVYRDKETWRKLQRRGMEADFSWTSSAQKYVDLYRKAIKLHQEAMPSQV